MRAPQHYTIGLQQISDALIECGYTKLDAQAKALGISRSTAWTIVKTKNKLGRLSTKTTNRILANPELPPSVRAVIHQYLTERCIPRKRRERRLEPCSFSRAQAASGY
jgi:hypothetical protein